MAPAIAAPALKIRDGNATLATAGEDAATTVVAGENTPLAVMAGEGPSRSVMAGEGPPSTPRGACPGEAGAGGNTPGGGCEEAPPPPAPSPARPHARTPGAATATLTDAAPAASPAASVPASGPSPATSAANVTWRGDTAAPGARTVATETPIALTYARTTHAVMLATPADLEDFAIGFSLAEGIIRTPADIVSLDIVPLPDGIECRIDLAAEPLDALTRRQRRMAGPSGCGLCGLDSIAAAIRPPPHVAPSGQITLAEIRDAMQAMQAGQALNAETRAVHAAAFWTRARWLVALREDVGRHNALDKLTGALARAGVSAAEGMILLSSRVSVEMVQKTAVAGAAVLAAISAPTSLAIQTAAAAGITLVGIARPDGCEVFTHPDRIQTQVASHAG